MTQEYDNTNRGILFVNDRKESDKHPDWKGTINVNGIEYWLSAWNKITQKGDVVSLSVTPKEKATSNAAERRSQYNAPSTVGDFDPNDDMGF